MLPEVFCFPLLGLNGRYITTQLLQVVYDFSSGLKQSGCVLEALGPGSEDLRGSHFLGAKGHLPLLHGDRRIVLLTQASDIDLHHVRS